MRMLSARLPPGFWFGSELRSEQYKAEASGWDSQLCLVLQKTLRVIKVSSAGKPDCIVKFAT